MVVSTRFDPDRSVSLDLPTLFITGPLGEMISRVYNWANFETVHCAGWFFVLWAEAANG